MNRKALQLVLVGLLSGSLLGCVYAPPPHGPAPRAHQAHHYDYYYYPHVDVYFHLYSGDYFYPHSGSWVRVRVLPKHLYLDHRTRRHVVIRDRHPYTRHHAHRQRYGLRGRFRADRDRDRVERDHNRRRHQAYRHRRG